MALWYIKLANYVTNGMYGSFKYAQKKEWADHLAINSVRAETVALHNLSLDHEALKLCEQAETMPAFKQNAKEWKPHIFREKMNIISSLPRFSITEMENLADDVRAVCEQGNSAIDGVLLFLNSESLARAYVKHGNLKQAGQVIQAVADRQNSIPNLGPIHKILFLRTQVEYSDAIKDQSGKDFFLNKMTQLSKESGIQVKTDKIS